MGFFSLPYNFFFTFEVFLLWIIGISLSTKVIYFSVLVYFTSDGDFSSTWNRKLYRPRKLKLFPQFKLQLLVIFQQNWFRFSKNTFHRLLGNKTIPIFLIWSDTNFARNIFQNCYQMVESCQVSIRTLRKHVKTFRYEYTN